MEYTNSNPSPVKEYILSVLARNKAGVLLRIAGLFSRRCYNILSIVAAQTEDTEYSRILIVVSGDDRIVRQVDKQLSKLIDIVQVDVLERERSSSANTSCSRWRGRSRQARSSSKLRTFSTPTFLTSSPTP